MKRKAFTVYWDQERDKTTIVLSDKFKEEFWWIEKMDCMKDAKYLLSELYEKTRSEDGTNELTLEILGI